MIDATFKHKVKGANEYDAVIQARTAELHFDLTAKVVRVFLEDAEMQQFVPRRRRRSDQQQHPGDSDSRPTASSTWRRRSRNSPTRRSSPSSPRIVDMIETVRKREAIKDGFAFASGRLDPINWGDVHQAFRDHADWIRRCNELETEWQLRISMAFGSLLFVILGAPVGILFAKRDFLSAFMTCFLPIIGIYYPLMLFGVNMSKEGLLGPIVSLWIGNVLLAVLAGFVLPSVVKH